MKALTNVNATSFAEAASAAQSARQQGQAVAFSAGGTDLLQQIKDGTDNADVIINLRTIGDGRSIGSDGAGIAIGGLVTLTELSQDPLVLSGLSALAQAADSVGTPQIRNVATLAGNVTQRPWCWYYRNGFNCFKAGGNECFSVNGENGQHAIFGGGPSYIVHPSDVAPALVAFDAVFQVTGPNGDREVSAEDFFVLPITNPERENSLTENELLTGVRIPTVSSSTVSTYHKIMDREAWTHAEVGVAAVIQRDGNQVQNAKVVLAGVAPIPWRVQAVEEFLAGQQIGEAVAREAGEIGLQGAQPLSNNAHKLPMISAAIERAILNLAAG
ncbi:MAG: FAD binding domain-containing protein [Gammaproteobacteria bacterium]|nr:FAD binding domain-containing protein [Gammaproteobacteria bacterium]MDD9896319.1 FAD binding domain-containing protein [Gammaproteobacteria bacterium]MDD9959226.1 FAD binding domain-containing protein [Gammaproteobacteria bacterium]